MGEQKANVLYFKMRKGKRKLPLLIGLNLAARRLANWEWRFSVPEVCCSNCGLSQNRKANRTGHR